MNLTQKEKMLLEDQKQSEELCIKKYRDYARQSSDSQLRKIFSSYADQEVAHLNTINQLLGESDSTGGAGQDEPAQQGDGTPKTDAEMCQDMLMTEKHVSGTYDTTIFECTDSNTREALNHIQKEEQQHGEGIFNYMQQQGYYKPQ